MPRGRSPNYGIHRGEILAHAASLFAKRGFPGTSINEVAAACGISKPALYHYFRDKRQLLVEICESHIMRLEAIAEEIDRSKLAPNERLREMIQRTMKEYAGARDQHRVLTEDLRFLERRDRERIIERERRIVTAFAEAIIAIRPELKAKQLAKPMTMLLFGMINWMFTWLKPDGALSYEAMGEIVSDLFLGGVSAVRTSRSTRTEKRVRSNPKGKK